MCMPMDHNTLDRVFRYVPITPKQERDLTDLHDKARILAESIRSTVSDRYQDQALATLAQCLSTCRQAIELDPKQSNLKIV